MRSGHWVGLGILATAIVAAATAALPQNHAELLPEDPAKKTVVAVCTACHDATEITTRRMDPNRWDVMVSKMIDLGAEVNDDERPKVVAYLGKYFSNQPPAESPPTATNAPTP